MVDEARIATAKPDDKALRDNGRTTIPVPEFALLYETPCDSGKVGLSITCVIAVMVVWMTWVIFPPDQAIQIKATPWDSRVGWMLSIAWPIQCGICMVVLS